MWRAYVDESELLHIVVVRYGPIGESSERSRRKCFQRLAFELDGHGVVVIAAEAREVKANKRDLQLFNQLRASRQIGHDMRLNHVPGPDEPLLWIADVVAGVVGARIRGVDECYKPLIDDIQVIRIDTKP